ncbi:MAG: AAA family ATPase [Bacteroidetes bacterium]|nr:AAA family ATPase [Bacteroidota bacterium]
MYSLFSTKTDEAGYRLQYFEVFNWGTFDKEIFKISPQCNTTLITGANGSGKTTFIQGLLTLIVPEKRYRFYEHQRTEESYVLGEYGDIETETGRQIQRLREEKENAFSILLATFKNEEKFVTLIQARWFSGSEMKRKYLIAFKPLTIEGDILPFNANGDWLKQLNKKYPKQGNKEVIQLFDGPSKYAEALLKVFGMRSAKALTLFDQTLRLKVMGSLDQFVRENMLEESKIEDDFQKLRSHYQTLLDIHRNMQKAEKQLELLKPVKAKSEELEKTKIVLKELSSLRETSPVYFFKNKENIFTGEIEKEALELKRITYKEAEIKIAIDADRDAEKTLDYDIRNDETGKQILELEKEIKGKSIEKGRRDDKLVKYNKAAVKISVEENPNEKLFYQQIITATKKHSDIEEELKDKENGIQKKLRGLENEKEAAEALHEEKAKELDELTKQKNNITGRVSEIRQEILFYTQATANEIPFIGELIQVLPKENKWEMAIEKVLRNIAMRLIVPEAYYKQVNTYVNDNKELKGKIVYERYQENSFMNNMLSKDKDSIFSKIEIRRESEYADWIESQIKTNYNFICTTKDDLPTYNKAVTINGLIKSGTRHERDERQKTLSRENYVLGWDNKEKIKFTREALKQLEILIKAKREEITKLEKRQNRLEGEKEDITKFLQYDSYSEIDWQVISLEIQSLTKRKEGIEKSNNRVKLLKAQLKELQTIISVKDGEREKLIVERTTKGSFVTELETQLNLCSIFLEDFKEIDFTEKFLAFEEKFRKELVGLDFLTIKLKEDSVTELIQAQAEKEGEKQRKIELQLQSAMKNFKRPEEVVMQTFRDWTSDTHKLGEELNYVEDYIVIHDRIEKDELIEYRTKFKKYLNEDMITGMSDFKTLLDSQEEQIRDSIDALNDSLKKIEFKKNPQTFIQLFAERDHSKDIDNFRVSLIDWKPDIADYEKSKDDQILERSFLKIKELIDKLTANDDWRKRVTDVRNWLKFLAKEFYREDMKRPPKVYENTAKLSSGEQAQITYTIMGAAIAYQYGILKDGMNANSFRFICVDEAFAKQDEEKADYLMDLAKKLNLQMLLVTPDDKIQIAEPYISGVHIVHRVNNRNSRIFDTTIEQAKKIISEKTLQTSDYNN